MDENENTATMSVAIQPLDLIIVKKNLLFVMSGESHDSTIQTRSGS